MNDKIILAETAGFCMGVSLALGKLDNALKNQSRERIFTYGPIIHNPQVLEYYRNQGVSIIDNWEEPGPGDTVLIRAHGIPLYIEDRLRLRNVNILDATCPKVKKAQLLIRENSEQADCLLIYGERNHPEVKGLLSYTRCQAYLFENLEELHSLPLKAGNHYCLVSQTTQDRQKFLQIGKQLQNDLDKDLKILDTICDATKNRQSETINIASRVECMVVVGGRNSGNTRRLYQVAQKHCSHAIHIETPKELDKKIVSRLNTVGLTAGASTPDGTIREVYQYLSEIMHQ